MFGNSAFDRVRQLFAAQFEADGDGFLYRKSSRGAPVRVTAAERDAFVAAFNRSLTWLHWGMVGAMLALVGGLVAWDLAANVSSIQMQLYVGMGLVIGVYVFAWYRAWGAPSKALAGRVTTGPARTKDEARRLALKRITWSQMGVTALLFPLALWRLNNGQSLLVGWNRLWLAAGAVLYLALAYRAFQKWSLERQGRLD